MTSDKIKSVCKKHKALCIAALLLILVLGSGAVAYAAGASPASQSDPLVTKSYVDAQLESSEKSGYICVTLKKGSTLSLGNGTTAIVTSGSCKARGALVDVTSGKKIKSGAQSPKNHMVLSAGSGKGLKARKASKVYVQGRYSTR